MFPWQQHHHSTVSRKALCTGKASGIVPRLCADVNIPSLEDDDRDALLKVIRILSNENQTFKDQVRSLSSNHQQCDYADVAVESREYPVKLRKKAVKSNLSEYSSGTCKNECQNTAVCWYFLNNRCKFGAQCRNLHQRKVCKYFAENRCIFGDNCWNIHDDYEEERKDGANKETTPSQSESSSEIQKEVNKYSESNLEQDDDDDEDKTIAATSVEETEFTETKSKDDAMDDEGDVDIEEVQRRYNAVMEHIKFTRKTEEESAVEVKCSDSKEASKDEYGFPISAVEQNERRLKKAKEYRENENYFDEGFGILFKDETLAEPKEVAQKRRCLNTVKRRKKKRKNLQRKRDVTYPEVTI